MRPISSQLLAQTEQTNERNPLRFKPTCALRARLESSLDLVKRVCTAPQPRPSSKPLSAHYRPLRRTFRRLNHNSCPWLAITTVDRHARSSAVAGYSTTFAPSLSN